MMLLLLLLLLHYYYSYYYYCYSNPVLHASKRYWMMMSNKVLAVETNRIRYKTLHRRARSPHRTMSLEYFTPASLNDTQRSSSSIRPDSW
jgi:hypothetical protein